MIDVDKDISQEIELRGSKNKTKKKKTTKKNKAKRKDAVFFLNKNVPMFIFCKLHKKSIDPLTVLNN